MVLATGSISINPELCGRALFHPLKNQRDDCLSPRWYEKDKSYGIGDETGGEQQCAGNQNQHPFQQGGGREFTAVDSVLDTEQGRYSLLSHQEGPDDRSRYHQEDGIPRANYGTYRDEKIDL